MKIAILSYDWNCFSVLEPSIIERIFVRSDVSQCIKDASVTLLTIRTIRPGDKSYTYYGPYLLKDITDDLTLSDICSNLSTDGISVVDKVQTLSRFGSPLSEIRFRLPISLLMIDEFLIFIQHVEEYELDRHDCPFFIMDTTEVTRHA